MSRQEFRSWMEGYSIPSVINYAGRRLDTANAKKLADAIILTGAVLHDIADPYIISPLTNSRIHTQWCEKCLETDFFEFASFLKKFVNVWQNCSTLPRNIDNLLVPFKGEYSKRSIQVWTYPLIKFLEYYGETEGDTDLLLYLNTFSTAWTRVNLRLDVEATLLEDYISNEAYIDTVPRRPHLIRSLRAIIEEWLTGFHVESLPGHGPGGVSGLGRVSYAEKYRSFGVDERLDYMIRRVPGWEAFLDYAQVRLDRCSEVVFVPKSILTYRTISMEPSVLQFYQQAVKNDLYKWFSDHEYIRHHIKLENQVTSRELARKGSIDRTFATIDLSSASDLVSWTLVKELFQHTSLYVFLLGTRSTHTLLPNGERLPLRKFAPMGSALCFPIECLIFSAVVEYCYRYTGYQRSCSQWLVYGDDIICRSSMADHVIEILHELGFKVNTNKTFTSTSLPFRESCGGEYWNGTDISPYRLPRNFPGTRHVTVEDCDTLKDLANRLYFFKTARSIVLDSLFTIQPDVLFSSDGKLGVKSSHPTNFKTRRCFPKKGGGYTSNIPRNRSEVHIPVTRLVMKDVKGKEQDEDIRLLEWYRLTRDRTTLNEPVVARVSRTYPKVCRQYAPLWLLARE